MKSKKEEISGIKSRKIKTSEKKFNYSKPIFSAVFVWIIIFLFVLGVLLYVLYLNLPGNPEKLNLGLENLPELENGSFNGAVQFYPNMKFNHNSISYSLDPLCSAEKVDRLEEAFTELSDKVGLINFYEVSNNSDIEVVCSEYSKQAPEGDYFIAGEGGAREIIQTGRYNVINQGIILLHENPHNFYECEWANIELHELIHVFGFDHINNEDSLMYPLLTSCNQKLDEVIVDKLKELYSKENLADLYFEEVSAIKSGRYLNFNLTVKNSGLVDAKNINLNVLDDGKLVKTFDLDDLKYGAGVKIEIQNLRLIHRNPEEIKFVLDGGDLIKEIDEGNNVAKSNF